jgi:hypothetical protein
MFIQVSVKFKDFCLVVWSLNSGTLFTGQVLHNLTHAPFLFYFSCFSGKVLRFFGVASDHCLPTYSVPHSWNHTFRPPFGSCELRQILTNIWPWLAGNYVLPHLCLWVDRITGMNNGDLLISCSYTNIYSVIQPLLTSILFHNSLRNNSCMFKR